MLAFLTGTGLLTLVATLGLPNRVVICERNDPSLQRHGWHVRVLRRLLYPRASAITVNSTNPAAVELLRHVSKGRPVYVVPNPQPVGVPRADPASSRIILAVGRLVAQKRHAALIDAFAAMHDQAPEWRMQILGDGPTHNDLQAQIEHLGLTSKIELVGHVDDPRAYYAQAGIFVLPSAYEGTSNALLEAAAAGLPCIVSDTAAPTGADDAIMNIPPKETEPLIRSLRELCKHPDLRHSLGNKAHHWTTKTENHDVYQKWKVPLGLTNIV
jgi:glycosyltransferase involved in cell wall biosynthesis